MGQMHWMEIQSRQMAEQGQLNQCARKEHRSTDASLYHIYFGGCKRTRFHAHEVT
jgi:hypothetical protein